MHHSLHFGARRVPDRTKRYYVFSHFNYQSCGSRDSHCTERKKSPGRSGSKDRRATAHRITIVTNRSEVIRADARLAPDKSTPPQRTSPGAVPATSV